MESDTDKGRAQPAEPARRAGRSLFPSCRDASRLQSEALDRPLTRLQRLGLALHLVVCKWCRRYGKQLRFLRQAARQHPEQFDDPAPQGLSAEARERLKESLRSSGK